jgi:hypothetical protein
MKIAYKRKRNIFPERKKRKILRLNFFKEEI